MKTEIYELMEYAVADQMDIYGKMKLHHVSFKSHITQNIDLPIMPHLSLTLLKLLQEQVFALDF